MDRRESLARLKAPRPFDILVIGGGATGCGVALDAATRGLDTALVEQSDFAQGTSSKSTKLVHGGVRYLEKAVLGLDREQFALVREGLRERGLFLRNAPHLAHSIRLMTPVTSWVQAGYVFAGLVLYDLLAGRLGLGRSAFVTRGKAQKLFPQLDLSGAVGAVTYRDGQFNDARMAVALARTAQDHGAACANHVEVTALLKENGRLRGATLRDAFTGDSWDIAARAVVNATGPFADGVRRMDDPAARDMLKVSSGIHILLDKSFAPEGLSLMIPSTEDGRVLFMIPWMGHVLFGTTDEPADVERDPEASERDIDYLLSYARKYLRRPPARSDVLAAWSGLRPLVFAPGKQGTQDLARTHVIEQSPSGLVSITGGKWTSYRAMAEEAVDAAVKAFALDAGPCATHELRLLGSRGFVPQGWRALARRFGLDPETARALHELHGDEAAQVAALGQAEGLMDRLHPAHPYILAQVAFAARREMAGRLADVLTRRLPLGLLEEAHAREAAPAAAAVMARELGWDEAATQAEIASVVEGAARSAPAAGSPA
ncbi:Glycerol-3-phosphate dehydrogenase 2 [Fundidesulfovibrio magnetotacticus]|uniref:Glycerol-3-phosphate dehydrogenase n=1 Tax=Fundidesulfovibrio magnetotacticus TaxID=2730080 RepID=A0A6V8LQW3_9BACT|nr:FAD-dependent oxidoreductase [Fundidesulfovibrio magnetotacticus]GFK92519.1 Glycerol-3-phosphate dehydrogenase 2 [Fundidesulfovibrio magnetotacticus]